MTEKMTVIRLPSGKDAGFMDYGEQTAEAMISTYRKMAADMRERADEIDAASDSDFRVEVVRGKIVEHPVHVLQEGRPHTPDCRCVCCFRQRQSA